jgi:hypothetical protein
MTTNPDPDATTVQFNVQLHVRCTQGAVSQARLLHELELAMERVLAQLPEELVVEEYDRTFTNGPDVAWFKVEEVTSDVPVVAP